MSDSDSGWRPLKQPVATKTPKGSFVLSPFSRLARVHAFSAAGDAMIAVALAGSLFFSIDPSAARWRVGLYLAFTIAPFALVAPLIGPAIDRAKGGRRIMVVIICASRSVLALLMISNVDSVLLFPLAFGLLVMGKSYAVTRAAIVPTTVRDSSELVDKNSRLALLTGVAGFAGGAVAALAALIIGPGPAVAMAMVSFGVASLLALRLPKVAIAAAPAGEDELHELRSTGIVLAASAMGLLRGIAGFMTFLIAFAFRGGTDDVDLSGTGTAAGAGVRNALGFAVESEGGVPPWQLGVVLAFSGIGVLLGSIIAPRLRRSTPEENILLGVLALTMAMGLLCAWSGDLTGAAFVALTVSFSASAGKLAFDSIVQRDAPDANYGRSFARFETRFQLIWVIGAIIPVVLTLPARLGFLVIAVVAGFAGFSYFLGSRGKGHVAEAPEPEPDPEVEFDDDELRASYPQVSIDLAADVPAWSPDAPATAPTEAPPSRPPDPAPPDWING